MHKGSNKINSNGHVKAKEKQQPTQLQVTATAKNHKITLTYALDYPKIAYDPDNTHSHHNQR